MKPLVEQHRRLAVVCPGCRARVTAPRRADAAASPFGPRLHATAVYLKTFQALSYDRLQKALFDLFGLRISQGGLTNMLRRAETRFDAGRDAALSALRRATVVASDETGVRIEGTNSYHWVFRCEEAVVHHAAPTRGACVVHEIMDGHRPAVWLSDRYSAQQGHAGRQQTCLAHLARDVAYALDAGDDTLTLRLKLWLDGAFALARTITTAGALDDQHQAPQAGALARRHPRHPGHLRSGPRHPEPYAPRPRPAPDLRRPSPDEVDAHNNACERDLRPSRGPAQEHQRLPRHVVRQGRGCRANRGGDRAHHLRREHVQHRAGHNRRLTALGQAPHPVGSYPPLALAINLSPCVKNGIYL